MARPYLVWAVSICLFVSSAPLLSQSAAPIATLVIGVYVAATDSTDASDTTFVKIPITVVAQKAPVFTAPSIIDTFRAGDTVRVALRNFFTDADGTVDNLMLGGNNPTGSSIRGDTLSWVVPPSARGTQSFQVVAIDNHGNRTTGTLRIFVQYKPPLPVIRFTGVYAAGDTVRLTTGGVDSVMVEITNVDSRDRSLLKLFMRDSTGTFDFVHIDTVGGAELPLIKIRFEPSKEDTMGPQSFFIDYDKERETIAFF